MGFFDKIEKNISKSVGKAFEKEATKFIKQTPNIAKLIGAVGAIGLMTGLLKPPTPCPAPVENGNNGNGGAGDPCGDNDNKMKDKMLGITSSLATPFLKEINKSTTKGITKLASGLGGAAGAGVSNLGGKMGLDPNGKAQKFLNNVTKSATANLANSMGKGIGSKIGSKTKNLIHPKVDKKQFKNIYDDFKDSFA
jgi:hypothetical protein